MTEIKIWIGKLDEENKFYYVFDCEYINCDKCKKEIKDSFLFVEQYDNVRTCENKRLCNPCFKEYLKTKKSRYLQEQYKTVYVKTKKQKDSIPYIPKPVQLKDTKFTSFDTTLIRSEKTIDRTVHAGRESWEGSQIGNADYDAICEAKDATLLAKAGDIKKMIANMGKSDSQLKEEELKKIEGKKKKEIEDKT